MCVGDPKPPSCFRPTFKSYQIDSRSFLYCFRCAQEEEGKKGVSTLKCEIGFFSLPSYRFDSSFWSLAGCKLRLLTFYELIRAFFIDAQIFLFFLCFRFFPRLAAYQFGRFFILYFSAFTQTSNFTVHCFVRTRCKYFDNFSFVLDEWVEIFNPDSRQLFSLRFYNSI